MLTGIGLCSCWRHQGVRLFLRADLLSTVPRLRLNHCLLVRCRFEQSAGLAARRRVAFAANQPTTKDSVFNQSGKYQQHFLAMEFECGFPKGGKLACQTEHSQHKASRNFKFRATIQSYSQPERKGSN